MDSSRNNPPAPGTAVLVVDLQADFTLARQGSLAVAGTDQAFIDKAAEAARALKGAGLPVFATQDWHPRDHLSFASNHEGAKPYEPVTLEDGRVQVMWPDHCVQGSPGAEILLDRALLSGVVRKGMDPGFDSYSGFRDDGGAETGLDAVLREAGRERLIVYGIATDYCVKATVLDGLAKGYEIAVIQELCRGVAPDTAREAWAEMERAGAVLRPRPDPARLKEPW